MASAAYFTDQSLRLRRIVENALTGATYESSREEEGRLLVIEGRRDGRSVFLRLRGVSRSEASETPAQGAALALRGVSASRGSCLGLFLPFIFRRDPGAAHVRIDIGTARLEVVCEDAEWWDEQAGATGGAS